MKPQAKVWCNPTGDHVRFATPTRVEGKEKNDSVVMWFCPNYHLVIHFIMQLSSCEWSRPEAVAVFVAIEPPHKAESGHVHRLVKRVALCGDCWMLVPVRYWGDRTSPGVYKPLAVTINSASAVVLPSRTSNVESDTASHKPWDCAFNWQVIESRVESLGALDSLPELWHKQWLSHSILPLLYRSYNYSCKYYCMHGGYVKII